MLNSSHDVSTLNSLIATTLDSVNGYREASADAESGRFQSIFTNRAAEREQCVSSLREAVRRLGGEPEDDGTALAGAHRAFVNLKSAVTGRDDQAIINEVERGEDHIKSKFEAALDDNQLGAEARAAVTAAWGSVKSGHDEMSALKHSMEGAR